MWSFDHPLMQYESHLHQDVIHNFREWADELSLPELTQINAMEIGQLIHMNEKHGMALLKVAKEFIQVNIEYRLQPLTSTYTAGQTPSIDGAPALPTCM